MQEMKHIDLVLRIIDHCENLTRETRQVSFLLTVVRQTPF